MNSPIRTEKMTLVRKTVPRVRCQEKIASDSAEWPISARNESFRDEPGDVTHQSSHQEIISAKSFLTVGVCSPETRAAGTQIRYFSTKPQAEAWFV